MHHVVGEHSLLAGLGVPEDGLLGSTADLGELGLVVDSDIPLVADVEQTSGCSGRS
jgi:hypothetical protein